MLSTFPFVILLSALTCTELGHFAAAQKFGPKLDENNEPRFLEQVKLFFNDAASKTGIEEEYLNLIKACQTVVRFNIPLRRDNGSLETITCYR